MTCSVAVPLLHLFAPPPSTNTISLRNEEDILLSTAVLTKTIQAVSCRRLLQGLFPRFLVDVGSLATVSWNSEFVSFTLDHKDTSGSLREKLIGRINHLSDDVRMMSFIEV